MNKTETEYDNSRPAEYNRWSEYPEVNGLVEKLVLETGARKVSGYELNMKIIVLDLYHSWLSDPEQYLGYHRGHNRYNDKIRLSLGGMSIINPHVTCAYYVGCIDFLIKNEYLTNKEGYYFKDEDTDIVYGRLSRMRPTEKFAALIKEYNLSSRMIGKFAGEDAIKLKGKQVEVLNKKTGKKHKVKPIKKLPNNSLVKRMTKIVREYNNQLERFHIDIDVECMTEADRVEFAKNIIDRKYKNYEKICLGNKSVYRVFNNGSFEQGGRFYGAWWIGCPSLLRRYITINGRKTVEMDYSGMHIQLLYALKGINYAELNEDAYSLVENDPDRKLNKDILLSALNAETEGLTAQSIFNKLRKKGELRKHGITDYQPIYEKIKKLKAKHPVISEYIANGYGIKLQYYDSCVIEELIKYALKKDIAILTIHDSVICQTGYSEFIRDKMWQLYRDFILTKFNMNINYESIQPNARYFYPLRAKTFPYRPPENYSINISRIIGMNIKQHENQRQFKKNTIISVKDKSRENICTGRCKHAKRVSRIKAKKYVFLKDVTIGIASNGSKELYIK